MRQINSQIHLHQIKLNRIELFTISTILFLPPLGRKLDFKPTLYPNRSKLESFPMKKTPKTTPRLANEDSNTHLVFHVIPHFLGALLAKYFRVELEGLENIPKNGPALIASNHSGYSGLDALLLCHHVFDELKRTLRVLVHQFWFLTKLTAVPAGKLGFVEAKRENGIKVLKENKLLLIFPEGENGNFKPTSEKYYLQDFKTGVIRMALETGAPIIPTLVIGAEETHINLAKLKFKKLLKMALPLPLNVIPLPARWKIIFLPEYKLKYGREALGRTNQICEMSDGLQSHMQKFLNQELRKRTTVYF